MNSIVKLTFVACLFFALPGCIIDTSSPAGSSTLESHYYFEPVTHEVVCKCTCESDNTENESTETHALPREGQCNSLNNAQCDLPNAGGFGKLKSCFKKSVPVSD